MATNTNNNKIRILTVGDGDLSLSLALARAYGNYVSLTASVFDSKEKLHEFYPDAPLDAMSDLDIQVLYEIDATRLHEKFEPKSWDLVCFHHPHLGLGSLEKDEADHANRHYQLVSHYLYSANLVSNSVHICLCGRQPETWRLLEAAHTIGLRLSKKMSTSVPFSKLWTDEELPLAEAKREYAAPRRYRYGKLGSRHMLGKFGYRHRRTEGLLYKGKANDTNVAGSMHYLFCATPENSTFMERNSDPSNKTCGICQACFSTVKELLEHLQTPAAPDTSATTIVRHTLVNKTDEEKQISISCATNETGDNKILKVDKDCVGKRLRWFIQHGIKGLSKKQAKLAIQESQVFVNNSLASDGSRVLSFGDTVLVKIAEFEECSSSAPAIEILYRKDPLLVAYKPSGMRTKGQFPGTLEACIEHQEGQRYDALSPLDSFCPGLCALIKRNYSTKTPSIVHSFTALVFEAVPETWKPHREATIAVEPRWKKRKRNEPAQLITIKLIPMGTTEEREDSMQLSTVRLETGTACSASSLCQYLRRESHGVVGDSNCRQEYLKVRRSIRNRIKDKLCIGCYKIDIDDVEIKKDTPEKLLWTFWDSHCEYS